MTSTPRAQVPEGEAARAALLPQLAVELFERLTIGVTIWHVDDLNDWRSLRFVASNPVGEALTQRRSVDCADRLLVEIYPQPEARAVARRYLQVALEQVPTDLEQMTYRLANGEEVYLQIRAIPIAERYVATLYSNIVEQVVASRRLAERSAALERSNRELEEFASVVSHDLREPLRKVTAFGDRLRRHTDGQLDERAADYVQRMVGAAGRMQALIDDLLTLSRVRSAKRLFVATDLAPLIADVLDDLEVLIEQTGGEVTVGPLPQVWCDPSQVRQLVQNLIGNALKFHKPGARPHVRVEAVESAKKRWVSFAVLDDGIGLDPRYHKQIFRVFQRLHGRGVYDGTGMGLAVCKRIVERHNGSIAVESAPGAGARFIVSLPRIPSPKGGPW